MKEVIKLKYKILAVDVDGTLLTSEDKITDRTKNAIRLAEEKGIIFVVSSGRPVHAVLPIIAQLGLKKDHPFISYNGAMAVKDSSGEVLYQVVLSPKDSHDIYRFGIEYDTTVMVWSNSKLFTNKLSERAYKYAAFTQTTLNLIDDPDQFFQVGATKILWYDEIDKISRYAEELKTKVGEGVSFYTSKPFYLEFVNSGISKSVALQRLGKYAGIKRKNIMAIGDGWNDLDMIKFAGFGVAMGNSEKEVRDAADFVTRSNDEDGVAFAIEKFILKT